LEWIFGGCWEKNLRIKAGAVGGGGLKKWWKDWSDSDGEAVRMLGSEKNGMENKKGKRIGERKGRV
jgi:hypothetical protein